MNRRTAKMLAMALAAVIGAWALWGVAANVYFNERAALTRRIGETRTTLVQYQNAQGQHKQLQAELQAFVDRTLGGDRETVDHRLRSRLSRIAEHVGLQNPSVGPFAPRDRESPAKVEFRGSSPAQRALRDEIDFYEVEGSVRGSGTFEQVLQLIASIEAESWLKRIDQVSFDPADNGARFDIDVRLTTLFLPRQDPAAHEGAALAVSSGAKDRYASFLLTNPFRVPPPPPVPPVKPSAPEPMAAPAAFAYEQWTLTGIAQSAAGREVWLLNRQNGQRVTLAIGDRLHDAVLLGVQSEAADFLLGNERFRVAVGRTLNDRSAISQ